MRAMLRSGARVLDFLRRWPLLGGFLLEPVYGRVWAVLSSALALVLAFLNRVGFFPAVGWWLAYHVAGYMLAMTVGLPMLLGGARLSEKEGLNRRLGQGLVISGLLLVVVIRGAGLTLALKQVVGVPWFVAIPWTLIAIGLDFGQRWHSRRSDGAIALVATRKPAI